MARSTRQITTGSAADASLRTWVLVISGFVVFYFGSQALTPENAHLWHWGLAFGGGVIGWLIGSVIERLRNGK